MARTLDWETFLLTPAGQTALAWEEAAFCRFTAGKTGARALQIGLWRINALAASPIGHRIALAENAQVLNDGDLRLRVLGIDDALPFADESCDLVVWPHGPDRMSQKTPAALAEISRVLSPNGILVTTFFNPMGAWKLREKYFRASHMIPDGAASFSIGRIKTMITQAGLTLEGGNFGVYAVSRMQSVKNARLPSWIDKAGDRWWPTLSNVVLLCARKTDVGLTLVGKVNFSPLKAVKGASALARKEMKIAGRALPMDVEQS